MDEIIDADSIDISKWASDTNFIIALLSWTMGLVNIFHTPRLFFTGFFYYIIIYIPLMVIIGIPLTFMELGISQFSNTSSTKSWNLCRIFKGIGYSKVTMALIFQIYYNVLNSYVLFYVMSSLTSSVKWAKCDISWANSTCYNFDKTKSEKNGTDQQSSIEQFWYNKVLALSGSNKLEWPHWELVGYFCATMVIVFLANCRGTKSLAKILPFTMIVSSLEIITLLFVTTITPGSLKGFAYLFKPHFNTDIVLPWKKNSMVLSSFQDILYSMGLGMGGFSSLGAQSSFRKPIHVYAILCNLVNVGLSLVYAVILFNFYAILSHHSNTKIEHIIQPKSQFDNSIFTVIPGGIFYLPGPTQLWIFIFYSSIFLKGLSSSIVMTSTILQVVYEFKPNTMKKPVVCSFMYSAMICVSGFILHTNLGIIISTFFNRIIYTTLLPLINTAQIIAVLYVYGLVNLNDDLQFMLGFRPSAFWQLSLVVSSFLLPALTVLSIVHFFNDHLYSKSDFITILERCVLSVILFWIPFMIMVRIIRKGIRNNILQPSEDWGPRDNILKKSRKMFKDQNLTNEYIYEKNLLKNKLSKYENDYRIYK